jgi:hypothetical protein
MNNDGGSVVERISTSLASIVWQRTTLTYLILQGTEQVWTFYGTLQGGWMVETMKYYVYGRLE